MIQPDLPIRKGRPAELILVRHGHVHGIAPPSFRGRGDLPLTELGLRQAAATRDFLATPEQPQTIYASPLWRCTLTAKIIAEPHSVPVTPVSAFIDMDYGEWQGRTFEHVRAAAPEAFALWLRQPHLAIIPGGEALADVAARVASVMRMIVTAQPQAPTVLVGHDVVNRVLLLLALELPLSRFWHIDQAPCAINRLSFDQESGWTVRSINETGHLASVAEPP